MRRPWGLRLRVLAAAGAIATVSAVTFAVMLTALIAQDRAAGPARDTTDALVSTQRVYRIALDLQTAARGYLLVPESITLGPYEAARRELPRALNALASVPNSSAQQARIATLRRELTAYERFLTAVVRRTGVTPEDVDEGLARFVRVRDTLAAIERDEQIEQTQRRAESTDLRRRALVTASVGLALLLVLIAVVSVGAVRAVVVPVGRLQRFARDLGARRFGTRLPESGPPETVELAQVFNTTAASLEAAEAELRRIGARHLGELEAVFGEAPLGLAFVDRELRYLRVNDALAELNGRSAADHLGRPVTHPEAIAALRQVLATGEPVLNAEIVVHGRRCEASFFGIRAGEDDPVAVGMAVTDIEGRRRAEDARERLQHATATLAATVTVTDVAEAAVAEARDTFDSDGAALMLRRGDWLQPVAIGGLTPEKHGRLAQVAVSARRPVAVAVRTGRPVYVRSPAEMAERFPQLSDVPALAALPLVTTGEPIGALLIDFTRPRALDAGERALLSALATQCAIALNRAQLFERERDVSQTLQASLLPRELPRIPGLDLAAELQAGTQGLDVGGDFYDAFAIGPGAWGIAIGDVCGKGVDAAALTALARHTVRAAAMGGASPGEVLLALNRAVLSEGRLGQFLTGIYARLRARPDGAFAVTLACGGHPPPVVLRADGAAGPLACSGTLLGVLEDPHLEESEAVLAPGDTLLLYTDGMTEAAAPERTMSAAEVADLLRAARASRARDTASDALAAVARMAGGALRDDVAVLVAQALSTEGRTAAGESSTRGQ